MVQELENLAIIGAGIGGLASAIALSRPSLRLHAAVAVEFFQRSAFAVRNGGKAAAKHAQIHVETHLCGRRLQYTLQPIRRRDRMQNSLTLAAGREQPALAIFQSGFAKYEQLPV